MESHKVYLRPWTIFFQMVKKRNQYQWQVARNNGKQNAYNVTGEAVTGKFITRYNLSYVWSINPVLSG